MKRLNNWIAIVPLIFLINCSSGAKRLNSDKDILSDTGGLTRIEMERAAEEFSIKIADFF